MVPCMTKLLVSSQICCSAHLGSSQGLRYMTKLSVLSHLYSEMENKISECEAQDEQSVNNLVAEFLAEKSKNSKFLRNVSLGKV